MRLAEADYDVTDSALNNRKSSGDELLGVSFFIGVGIDEERSTAEARPIFKDEEHICIMVPGDKDSIIKRRASIIDKRRFAAKYKAFQANQAAPEVGTPLNQVTFITPAQIAELNYFNVRTVEQLVGMPDSNMAGFMGGQQLRTRAKDWLEAARGAAPMVQMRAELDSRDVRLAEQEAAMNEMKAQLAELMAAQTSRKRGKADDE